MKLLGIVTVSITVYIKYVDQVIYGLIDFLELMMHNFE